MATHTGSTADPPDARPDHEYAIVAGLYVAALLAPAVLIAVAGSLAGPAALYVGFLVATTAIAVIAGLLVSRTNGIAVSVGRHAACWLLAVVPIAWFVGVLASVELAVDAPAGAGMVAILGAGAGTLLGLLFARMSRNRHTAARLVGAVTFGQWEARLPRRWRHTAIAIAAVVTAVGLGAIPLGYFYDTSVVGRFHWLLYVWAPLAGLTAPRTFRVTDAGLVRERPMVRRIRSWSSITGYTLTDDALVVHQSSWWRPAIRSDRSEVEDLDAVVAALDDALADRT